MLFYFCYFFLHFCRAGLLRSRKVYFIIMRRSDTYAHIRKWVLSYAWKGSMHACIHNHSHGHKHTKNINICRDKEKKKRMKLKKIDMAAAALCKLFFLLLFFSIPCAVWWITWDGIQCPNVRRVNISICFAFIVFSFGGCRFDIGIILLYISV